MHSIARNFRVFILLFLLLQGKGLHSQLSGCNLSGLVDYSLFPSNSVTNFTAYSKALVLCGPNTIVYDTLVDGWGNNPMRNKVLIGETSKFII